MRASHSRGLSEVTTKRGFGSPRVHSALPITRRRRDQLALHSKLRRAVRARGHFPTDEVVLKLLFLVLNLAAKEWRMPAREWTAAKAQFAILFEDRFAIT